MDEFYQQLDAPVAGLLRDLGAHLVPHSRRTLAEHLVGTYDLLQRWGNDDAVCLAGLCHSIYGTRVFNIQCADFSSRKMIQGVIGPRAEELAYLFCVADRDGFFAAARSERPVIHDAVSDTDVRIDRGTLASLLEIEAANIVEHLPRRGRSTRRDMRWYKNAFRACSTLISASALAAIEASLDSHTSEFALST